jgi:DNA-binding beta-propeller fold protein YncE
MNKKKILFLFIVMAISSQSLFSKELTNNQVDLGLKVTVYAPKSNSTKFKTPTHIAFVADDLEIVTDLENNRFMYRKGPDAPFQISPVPVKAQHSLVYNPADKLYYANDTGNHRIIAFKSLSSKKISAETKNIAGVALNRPHDIVLDPATGWIYAINPNSGHVFRFKAIGKDESALKVPVKGYSRGLTFVNGKLYVINSAEGRVVEIVDWKTKKFKIYDSFDPTKRSANVGSWKKTGLVLNDVDYFNGYWYATSFFTKSHAGKTDPDEHKFIRFKKLEDLATGKWTDLSRLIPKGIVPYYLTKNEGKLYLAIFRSGSSDKGDSILQLTPVKTPPYPVKK